LQCTLQQHFKHRIAPLIDFSSPLQTTAQR